jgi:EmrB/QacA subfamily drug resistance transporter
VAENLSTRTRWIALFILCIGDLMIVVDTTVVNVALPSIRNDLGFSQTSLAWVVNAYMLTFGGLLLLAGRFGDLFGHRRLFLSGTAAFTVASLICGVSNSKGMLIVARAVQGLGGAVVSAVAFSLIVVLFTEPGERAKAMGIFGFVMSGGGSIGVLAGGLLTDFAGWHWVFLVNLPIGVIVTVAGLKLLPAVRTGGERSKIDIPGAIAITGAMLLAIYAIVNGNSTGWTSAQTLGLLAAALLIGALFCLWESRVNVPLVPLRIFRHRNLSVSSVVGILWTAAMFAMFFLSALYLQLVLHYSPLQVGLAFAPANVVMMVFSLGLSAKLVTRFGFRRPLLFGLSLVGIALLWFTRAPVDGSYLPDVLPSMIILGIGTGITFNPVLMGAVSDVNQQDAGLASGIANTAFMMGGALGLAVLASAAAARAGHNPGLADLTRGYHLAFVIGAVFAFAAAALGAALLRETDTAQVDLPSTEAALEAA